MQAILACAVVAVLAVSLALVWRCGNLILSGQMPARFFAFFAILFTSGLDVGLIMFPLTEFPVYETEQAYSFANPLAIEFGFWGFLIWIFYFLTTFYFCIVEPRLKIFDIPWVKLVNNSIVIATCAFTGFLFLQYLPDYIEGITPFYRFSLVALVLLAAVFSSTDIRYVKILSLSSTWLFFALVVVMWAFGGLGLTGLASNLFQLGEYFTNIHRFILPFSDYHAFYLFWWFAWSIMIGQFVSRFVGELRTWQLFLALLIIPSIPISIWFSVLYGVYEQGQDISGFLTWFMVLVGVIFVTNSLDSLTRLYTDNLQLTVDRLGRLKYIGIHWLLLYSLILFYQFTPLQIEWIGLVVIGLYAVVALLVILRRKLLVDPVSS
ncbi:MAG TPA: choline transporter [Gammaproteobacteria bacterium]|nr:choline transporter [Gammaproteobacteria bacterium]HAT28134.1 choline transporter [Gammaproteobacteria bacterium]|tara:strand:+ start:102 stop:1235 length:1134 start_codon:yes stop_codon:yes gene_type:complete